MKRMAQTMAVLTQVMLAGTVYAQASVDSLAITAELNESPEEIHYFSLDTNPGWSITGEWAFGTPIGQGGNTEGYPDPTGGATGTNVYGINLNGDYSTELTGPAYLTTGPLDFTKYENVTLQFQRWLNTDYQPYVKATIEASTDAKYWTLIWSNGSSEITDSWWTMVQYDISAIADDKSAVYVRWGHEIVDNGALAYSGWNIDEIRFLGDIKDNLYVVPHEGFVSEGPSGGPFAPDCMTYTLTNEGNRPIAWEAAATEDWLDIIPSSGSLLRHDSITVNVCVNENGNVLAQGFHTAIATFTNTVSNVVRTRGVMLNVIPPPPPRAFCWFPLQTDPGWTTEGQWEFGVPQGGGSHCKDPRSGRTGSNVYGYNLAGDYPNQLPEYHLTTTRLNCFQYENISLSFWRRLGIESSYWDQASIQVSNDGINWTDVWKHDSEKSICDTGWVHCEYDISAVANRQASVYIRWTMGPTDYSITYPGWNIDDVALSGDRVDDLYFTPWDEDLTSSGIEGGPFTPACKTYTLTNIGSETLNWTVTGTADWLDVTPASGMLVPDQSTTVNICINANANSLTRGTYSDTISFCNTTSGLCYTREVTLTVDPYPAEVEVTDSILPADDLNMPFGNIFVGASRTEQVTVTNADDTHDLVITNVSRGRKYSENFDDGLAQNWNEDVDANWRVVSGEYRAQSSATDFMFATYAGYEWNNLAVQVDCRREGSGGVPGGVTLRASSNFDEGVGSGYCFQIYTYGYFIVWKQVNGNITFLQDLTQSSQINSDNNTLLAVADDNLLQFFINGTLVWSGVDNDLTTGRIGLGGYTSSGAVATYYFDNVLVDEPVSIATTISDEQQWYNERPYQGLNWKAIGENIEKLIYPGGGNDPNMSSLVEIRPLSTSGFHLTLPPEGPPWIVPPLSSLNIGVTFEPDTYKEYTSSVVIECNDEDEPDVEVLLSGTGLRDYLEIAPPGSFEFWGHPGGPFTPSSKDYALTNTGPVAISWSVTKTASWLDLSSVDGILEPSEFTTLIVSLNAEVYSLAEGVYTDTLVFTNTTSGIVHPREIILRVQKIPKIWVEPQSLSVSVVEGGAATETLTIGNIGDADLQFNIRTRDTGRSVVPQSLATKLETGGNVIVLEYEFGKMAVDKQGEYTLINIMGLEQYQRTGAPIIPVRPVAVIIPYGKEVTDVRVIPLDMVEPPEKVQLPPAQKPYPLSHRGPVPITEPDPTIYNRSDPWPGTYYEKLSVQSKCGYQILTINLFPLQYIPASGKVSYSSKLRLEVDLTDSAKQVLVRNMSPAMLGSLTSNVDNPSALASYSSITALKSTSNSPLSQFSGGPYEFVIITSAALENTPEPWNFQALLDAKQNWGITGTIVTTEFIYNNYDGTCPSGGEDNQTRIRNFLIDAYQNWGTQYVLLAGTSYIVPARMFNVSGDSIPCDMYYGCVDPTECTFDYNANGIYGEQTDGVNGSDV
ncbi:MAG: hypothetical protein JSV03_02735, partial [Planctomycetota bacterium]